MDGMAISKPESIARQVHKVLRERILSGEISPGARLVGVELAASLAVSRTPVREALLLLQADGLVSLLKNGVAIVKDIRAELADILGIRAALEVYAAKRAIGRLNAASLRRLGEICAAAERLPQGAFEERARLNREFHEILIGAAGNRRLVEMAGAYREYFNVAARLYDAETMRRSNRDHRAILKAIAAKDTEAVESLIEGHLQRALDAVRRQPSREKPAASPDFPAPSEKRNLP
ncbi:MAG: GntR family transcriptional regulator [Alphaproteobacteria bacterium]